MDTQPLTIFISIPWFTPAFQAGGPVQSIANMVDALDAGYRFYIFTSDTDLGGERLEGITPGEWVAYNDYTQVWYAPKEQRSNTLLKQVELLAPELLYIVGIYSWYFTQVPVLFAKTPVKLVSVRGMLHPGALSEKKLKKQLYLRAAQWLKLPQRVHFHASDATEQWHIATALGKVRCHIAGNFPRLQERVAVPQKQAGALRLVSIALLSPMKNILAVVQALAQCTGEIAYEIYGPEKDYLYVQECREAARKLPGHIQVSFCGEVAPEMVPKALSRGQVFILPSKSENYGHAIAEALSAGLPVITSEHTPWNGLEAAQAGINVIDSTESLAAAIRQFAQMQQETYEAWRRGARAYALEHARGKDLKVAYEQMFAAVREGRHG